MKILLVEDNHFKREKVLEFLSQISEISVSEAASYNRGLSSAGAEKFDLIVLDMSMPTFDRTETERGGRFRVFGGKEIVSRLVKQQKLSPFVILTGYSQFSDEKDNLSLAQINDLLTLYGEYYKGTIYFDSATSVWKQDLSTVIEKLKNA
ncbi:response regulator [Pseudomonas sp. MAFF 301449]|uniref:Response regulator n=2 Tax=Pseudomonas cyclaminis TaxID=2781239 RepID=A0ABR9SN10_9PSED|nr:response regulator [Pseudomonas cyclaminis]MBE8590101.1 response regulator [Pseudomonas cyclaminis]